MRASVRNMLQVQQEQLASFAKFTERKQWNHIHSDHFDWYMFPIEDGSQRQYNVLSEDVKELKSNETWLTGYRRGVEYVAQAWGWDVKTGTSIDSADEGQRWTRWDVRLAKMLRSLWIFGQKDYLDNLLLFARKIAPNGGLKYGGICLDEVFLMKL